MKKVAVFFANGFEEVESLTVVDYLRRADIQVDMVSTVDDKVCVGAHNIKVNMDILLNEIDSDYDGYIIPGGSNNAISMKNNSKLLEVLKTAFVNNKLVASICAGPIVLHQAGILDNIDITSYPGVFRNNESGFNYKEDLVVIDKNVITSRGPATAVLWSLSIIEYLLSKDVREKIEKQILFNLL